MSAQQFREGLFGQLPEFFHGVDELDPAKLSQLLRLRYHDSIADAVADLGRSDEIGHAFAGFQRYTLFGRRGVRGGGAP